MGDTMKVVVLLRYPRVERAAWKRQLIDQLIDEGFDVTLVFGASTYLRHAEAAFKTYGYDFFKKKRELAAQPEPRLAVYFSSKVPVLRTDDLNGRKTVRYLQALEPDLLLLLGTGIIRKHILDIPRIGTVHCHQGCLPRYRGVNTIEWSIYDGQNVCITTHFVSPGIDTGDILLCKKIPTYKGDDIELVRARCQEEAVDLLTRTIGGIRNGTIRPRKQKAAEGKQYFSMHPFFVDIVNRLLNEGAPLQSNTHCLT